MWRCIDGCARKPGSQKEDQYGRKPQTFEPMTATRGTHKQRLLTPGKTGMGTTHAEGNKSTPSNHLWQLGFAVAFRKDEQPGFEGLD